MAGITDGVPEVAVGEPLKLGDNGEYELEHDPLTDRLIVRDTVNNKEAYVRPETNERMGHKGAFIRSLVNSEPLADDGRLHSSVQAAEEAANGWVFVPPGTFNGLTISTENLTLMGAGEGTVLNGGIGTNADGVTVRNLRCDGNIFVGDDSLVVNCSIRDVTSTSAIYADGNSTVAFCNVETEAMAVDLEGDNSVAVGNVTRGPNTSLSNSRGVMIGGDDCIAANNICIEHGQRGIQSGGGDDAIIIGNQTVNITGNAVAVFDAANVIIANNRLESSGAEIDDSGTNTELDANVTGGRN